MNENIIVAITKLNEIVTDIDKDDTCFLDIKDTVEEVIALLKAKDINVPTKWVSVKDRLPENNRFVLVCNDDGHMMVAQYIEETAQWQYKYINYDVDVWDDEEQGPVCWWVELPEPPKEGDGE